MNQKKQYVPPEADIEKFTFCDIVTESPTFHGIGDEGDNQF